MKKEKFNILINSSKEKVWQILWNDETYRKWTAPFSDSSYMETDWKIGGKTFFLDGKGNGMASTIFEFKENEFLSFKHLGCVKDGVEDYESEEVKQYAGTLENYYLNSKGNQTELIIEVDIDNSNKDYFNETFSKALNIVKQLSE